MTGIVSSKGITVRKGDSFTIVLRFKLGNGDLDISGAVVKMAVRGSDNNLLLNKLGVVSDAAHGVAAIELTPQDTNLPVGEYQTDIQITFADGQVHTIYPQNINSVAYFKITEEVTA